MDLGATLRILREAKGDPAHISLACVDLLLAEQSESERENLRVALQVAAIPHWFDEKILGVLLDGPLRSEVQSLASQLRRLPVVKPFPARGPEAANVHETSRLALRGLMKDEFPNRLAALSKRARIYFNGEAPHLRIEALYHGFIVDPEAAQQECAILYDEWNSMGRNEELRGLEVVLDELLAAGLPSGEVQSSVIHRLANIRCNNQPRSGAADQAREVFAEAQRGDVLLRVRQMDGPQSSLREVLRLIRTRDYQGSLELLKNISPAETKGESEALKGNACFMLQRYDEAARAYLEGLKYQKDSSDWQDMYEKSRRNAIARIDMHLPPLYFFADEKERLLEPASAIRSNLPAPLRPRRVIWPERIRREIGTALGAIVTFVVDAASELWGEIAGYKGRVWTNWYRRSLVKGVLTLAHMRDKLNKNNLVNTYPQGSLTGFQQTGQTPPQGVTHFRTADGSWNNLSNPKEGAAGTRFLRNVRPGATLPEAADQLMTPNPREISRKLLTREGDMPTVPFLNLLAAAWIQFENHDWISHGEILLSDVHEIPLAKDDPARNKYHLDYILVGKTQPDPTRLPEGETTPVTFINEVTHWWDGSQIYGSNQETQDRLRSFVDGKMIVSEKNTLPLDGNHIEKTGFQRNWWIGLTVLHTLFVREHNAICDQLKISYPQWEDNRLFNVARLINAAVMAKIHTVEWTPAILPNPGLNAALNANWFGILTNICECGDDRQTLSEIKIKNPEMGGVVGNPINKHGTPYGLTEEFVEVYRLHSLLPETLELKRIGLGQTEEVPLPETRQAGSAKLTNRFSVADILHSFGTQQPGQLVLNNFPRFMQELSIPGNPLFDMGAVDILRARERGVPRYNEFRRQLGLNPIQSFADLTDKKDQLQRLREVYGSGPDKVEDLDLMIGTLAESTANRPTNFGFGETMFQIFILNATRRLQADRFFTDSYNEDTYTREGLDWIDASSFKKVLLRNFPELAFTGLANVRNAFEPWDNDNRLDPTRHPLRAYDQGLQPDPWLGDVSR
jgi:tetratricopeptide (TPR) repeat protein